MRESLAALPLETASSRPLPKLVADFCLLTNVWELPKELEGGRFAADIVGETRPRV